MNALIPERIVYTQVLIFSQKLHLMNTDNYRVSSKDELLVLI